MSAGKGWGLEIDGITKSFQNGKVALENISFAVSAGQLVTLLGPSGCGKTTLLRIIAGLEEPTQGKISATHLDQSITFVGEKKFLSPHLRNVGMVFQSYALWPNRTVFENISFPLEIQRIPLQERKEIVRKELERVSLSGLEQRYPHELSGGQQQRVALARALAQKPRILLLDEPLSNLDTALRTSLRKEIKELNRALGLTMIYVTHDDAEANELSDRKCIFDHGKLVSIEP